MKTFLCLIATLAFPISAFADEEAARLAELDAFWAEVSRTVKEGDFEGYSATCHPEAVLVTNSGSQPQRQCQSVRKMNPARSFFEKRSATLAAWLSQYPSERFKTNSTHCMFCLPPTTPAYPASFSHA